MVAQALSLKLQTGVVGQQLLGVVAHHFGGVWVLLVEVVVGGFDLLNAHPPCAFVFHAGGKAVGLAAPPGFLKVELFDADGLGFVVVFHARWVGVFVVPNVFGGFALGEEQQVGFDAGVGGKHAVGQAHDGVQVAFGQQLFFDTGLHAFAKQRAVGQHQRSAAVGFEDVFDKHQKQVCRFFGAHIGRKAVLDAWLFDAAKGRVGEDDVHALGGCVVAQRASQGVAVGNEAGHLDAVQHEVGHAQHVGHLFFLDAANAVLQNGFVFGVVHLLAQVFDGADQKTAGAGGRVHHALAQAGIHHVHHELRHGAGRVELARVAGALQVFEDFFVEVVELVALGLAVEVDGVELVDDLAQQLTALHVVVGVFKHAAHHIATGVALGVATEVFECGEKLVVDKVQQGITRDAFGVKGPVAPAHGFGQWAFKVVGGNFHLLFKRIKYFEEQEPSELRDALRVAIHATVLAHDVLDGFDDGGEVGHCFSLRVGSVQLALQGLQGT